MHKKFFERKHEDYRRYKKLDDKLGNKYASSGAWYDREVGRYKRYWRSQRSSEIKRRCNRSFRKNNADEISQKSNKYRRYTEFEWEYD